MKKIDEIWAYVPKKIKMTKSEIERELGYKITIVEERVKS